MRKVLVGIAIIAAAAGASIIPGTAEQAEAKDCKIGYIDVPRILEEYEGFQEAKKELDKDREKREEEFAKKFKEFQKYGSEVQEKWSLLSETKKREKQEELAKRQKELQDWRNMQTQELAEKEEGLIKRLEADVRKVLEPIGDKKKLCFVVRKDLFLYVERGAVDVTNEVLQALRRQGAGKK